MRQHWDRTLFLHWKIEAERIQHLVPFPLDLFEGKAAVSIVPFRMSKIEFPYVPKKLYPFSLWELNLRTYVVVNGKPGVYFFTLDTDSGLGQLIGRHAFSLAYRYANFQASTTGGVYSFQASHPSYQLNLEAKIKSEAHLPSPFEKWCTDRERLFTRSRKQAMEGMVRHEPWTFRKAHLQTFHETFSRSLLGFHLGAPESISYADPLDVFFKPFQPVSSMSLE